VKQYIWLSRVSLTIFLTGRWLTYPSEKKGSSVGMILFKIWKNRIHVPNHKTRNVPKHQPVMFACCIVWHISVLVAKRLVSADLGILMFRTFEREQPPFPHRCERLQDGNIMGISWNIYNVRPPR
jgi:hypothetical protein